MGIVAIAAIAPTVSVTASAPDHLTITASASSPARNTTETITTTFTDGTGKPVAGAKVGIGWSLWDEKRCTGTTNAQGQVQCTRNIRNAKTGKRDKGIARTRYQGYSYKATTTFRPQ